MGRIHTTADYAHSYSLTVFSPSGKLVQIEHALAAVSSGTTSLGIKGMFVSSASRSLMLIYLQRQMG